jgi:flavodoxin
MKYLVVYSSKSGNSKKLADVAHARIPAAMMLSASDSGSKTGKGRFTAGLQ